MLRKHKKKIKLKLLDCLTTELFKEFENIIDVDEMKRINYTISYLIDKKHDVSNGTK